MMMEEEFYNKQKKSFYKEVLIYIVVAVAIAWGLPAWISMIAWGLLLIERADHFNFLDKIWDKINKYK